MTDLGCCSLGSWQTLFCDPRVLHQSCPGALCLLEVYRCAAHLHCDSELGFKTFTIFGVCLTDDISQAPYGQAWDKESSASMESRCFSSQDSLSAPPNSKDPERSGFCLEEWIAEIARQTWFQHSLSCFWHLEHPSCFSPWPSIWTPTYTTHTPEAPLHTLQTSWETPCCTHLDGPWPHTTGSHHGVWHFNEHSFRAQGREPDPNGLC